MFGTQENWQNVETLLFNISTKNEAKKKEKKIISCSCGCLHNIIENDMEVKHYSEQRRTTTTNGGYKMKEIYMHTDNRERE